MIRVNKHFARERFGRTTARLVSTDNVSQPLVIGGIWVIQASIPTGMVWFQWKQQRGAIGRSVEIYERLNNFALSLFLQGRSSLLSFSFQYSPTLAEDEPVDSLNSLCRLSSLEVLLDLNCQFHLGSWHVSHYGGWYHFLYIRNFNCHIIVVPFNTKQSQSRRIWWDTSTKISVIGSNERIQP